MQAAPREDLRRRTVVVALPPCKPSEPNVSAGAAAQLLRAFGCDAVSIDASIEWHRFALSPGNLKNIACKRVEAAGWMRAAIRGATRRPHALQQLETYQDRRRYTSAVNEFENALRTAADPYAGVRLATAMIALAGGRLESSAVLEQFSLQPGPFDGYFTTELIPRIASAAWIGLSVAFQQQMPAAVRLCRLLREHGCTAPIVLGGPLVAAWKAAGISLDKAPFSLFDACLAGEDHELRALGSRDLDGSRLGPRGPSLQEPPWEAYLSPMPVVPAAVGRGCSYRRCTFCPEHMHPAWQPCSLGALDDWLRSVAARFPAGAMLHLTDSALSPAHLEHLGQTIVREKLPLRWHGFVRVQEAFADPRIAALLASGGCAMLQFGVESASRRVLANLGKGDPERSRSALRACAAAGIRTHVYLLFGVPGETDEDREATLQFVQEEHESIHAINAALLNLPKGSAMHRDPARFGITQVQAFHADTDLSLYDDFRCGDVHPRLEARRWMESRLLKSDAYKAIQGRLRVPFKANHLCFL
jgi:hypothetical protein